MSTMSCEHVQDLIELHALGECEGTVARDMDRHLAACPACRGAQADTARLMGLLDCHYQADEGLARLQSRLRVEERRLDRPRSILPFVRRMAAVAAVLLLALGLSRWLTIAPAPEEPRLVALLGPGTRDVPAPEAAPHAIVVAEKLGGAQFMADAPLRFTLDHSARTPEELRNGLRLAARDGLPPGPVVGLSLTLTNDGRQPVWIDVGGARTMLRLDLRGPGVLTLFGKARAKPPFLEKRLLKLAPGERIILPIPHLIGGRPDVQEGAYWTRPGRYTLAALYRVRVFTAPPEDGASVERTFFGPPIVIDVS